MTTVNIKERNAEYVEWLVTGGATVKQTKAYKVFGELFELVGSQRAEQALSELVAAEKKRVEESCCFRTPAYLCGKPAKFTVRGKLTRGHGERQVVFLRSCPTHVGHLMGCPPEGAWTDTRWGVSRLEEGE